MIRPNTAPLAKGNEPICEVRNPAKHMQSSLFWRLLQLSSPKQVIRFHLMIPLMEKQSSP